MNRIELKKKILEYAKDRNKKFSAKDVAIMLNQKLDPVLRSDILACCSQLEKQGKLVLVDMRKYCIATSSECIHEVSDWQVARRHHKDQGTNFNLKMGKAKHLLLLFAFLVTWKTYEGQKIESSLRFIGDKSTIGTCVCRQVDHSEQFQEADESKALALVEELKADPMATNVQLWRMELRK